LFPLVVALGFVEGAVVPKGLTLTLTQKAQEQNGPDRRLREIFFFFLPSVSMAGRRLLLLSRGSGDWAAPLFPA
jgi:hypothetical protein